MNRRRFLLVAAGFAVAGRSSSRPPVVWRGTALGAQARVTLGGDPDRAEAALAAVRAEIDRAERLFSLWRPDSALARLNATGGAAAPGLAALVGRALAMHRVTRGFFDPTVQPLWRAVAGGAGPEAEDAARRLARADRVRVGGDAVRIGPGMALTLNGIAQGWLADRARAALAAHGYADALADLGEIAALGRSAEGRPWRVGVAHPATGAIVTTVALAGRAAATSAPLGTRIGPEGAAHILDPVGAPGPRPASVTVVAGSATLADALSTAAAAAPEGEAEALLRDGGAEEAVIVTASGAVLRPAFGA